MSKTIFFNDVYLYSVSTVSGKKEKEGPLGKLFDYSFDGNLSSEKTYEQLETKMIKTSIDIALSKAHLSMKDIDLCVGGDLTDQISSSNEAMKSVKIPFIGVYGACSTSMLSLLIGSSFVSNMFLNNVLTFTSSNFYAQERQFRYPVEYGGGRKETSTVTVSGAGCAIVSNKKSKINVYSATVGQVFDVDWKDPNNMGAVMAYAAFDTIKNHLKNTGTNLKDYSLIMTGDLSKIGSKVLKDLFVEEGMIIDNHLDAGTLIYSDNQEEVYSGGSGCACLPLVCYTKVVDKLIDNTYKRVLLVGTGCLHSKMSNNQKLSIPVIAHAVELRRV